MKKLNLISAAACTATLACTIFAASTANASGFGTARFGGEHGHLMTDEPTAIYYNPAGITLKPGIDFMVDGAIAYRLASYTHTSDTEFDPADNPPGPANSGEATLTNVAAAPMLGITAGIPVSEDIDIGFGAGFFVPFGGAATWDQNDVWQDSTLAPGPVDGVQRWYSIHGTLRSMYVSGAFSIGISKLIHIGISGGVALNQIDSLRARNADGSNNLDTEGRAWLKAAKWTGHLGGGILFTPLDGKMRIGFSYQAPPGLGEQKLEGTLVTHLGGAIGGREEQVELTQHLPDTFRLGISYRFTDLELRLFGDFQRWSLFQDQCIAIAGEPCEVNERGEDINGTSSRANLPRRWKDAGGVRAGVSYWFAPEYEIMGGVGYDSNAIPGRFLDPALTDFNDISVAVGLKLQPIPQFGAMLGYTHLFYIPRDTNDIALNATNEGFLGNSTGPDNRGEYTQTIGVFHVNVIGSFDPFGPPEPAEQAQANP